MRGVSAPPDGLGTGHRGAAWGRSRPGSDHNLHSRAPENAAHRLQQPAQSAHNVNQINDFVRRLMRPAVMIRKLHRRELVDKGGRSCPGPSSRVSSTTPPRYLGSPRSRTRWH